MEAPVPPLATGSAVVSESEPSAAVAAKRFVEDAVVEKNAVVVAFVPVAFVKVNACSVEDPDTRRLVSDARPDALIENSDVPAEERTSKKFAV